MQQRHLIASALAAAITLTGSLSIAGSPCDHWDGTIGTPGMANGEVRPMIIFNGNLIVAGSFTTAGGNAIRRVARYDANDGSWHPLGTPPNDGVSGGARALIEYNGDLIIGGSFTNAGGVPVANIARWNPVAETWHAMGAGLNQTVTSLAVYQGDLYAGGVFTNSGGAGNPVSRIARWNPNTEIWEPIAGTINNPVNAMAVFDGELYFGGTYSDIGGTAYSNIARWNGTTINSVGLGVGGQVSSMTVGTVDNVESLFVGGAFTSAGGIPANRVARWDGQPTSAVRGDGGGGWSAVGTGMGNNVVFALGEVGGKLYAGGTFTTAGGQSAPRIARYVPDLGDWQPMGTASSNVLGLLPHEGNMLVAGLFTTIGGVPSNRIATWVTTPPPVGDLDGDCIVGPLDLLILATQWGPCDGCSADLNGDGRVDILDILVMFANWG